ncbi:MAG: Uma2 family endonuclease [Deltaproteobacteria bacterium]|nr:Uma2 family endonuclease [Deltaproteobacteria bacterium]
MDLRNERLLEPADRDQVIVLRGVSWDQYVALSEQRRSSKPLMAYLDGELEIVSTSRAHEIDKKLIARFVEAYVDVADIELGAVGNATFRKKLKRAGLEPDECYCVGPMREFPTLAIEVVYTSGGINKLEIYRRLGVPEVWFWIDRKLQVYWLTAKGIELRDRSVQLPDLDLDKLTRAVHAVDEATNHTHAVRAYRQSLKRRR